MRKRKPPYILVSVAIVIGAVLFINNGARSFIPESQRPAELAPPTKGEARETDSVDEIAQRTQAAVGAKDTMSAPGDPKMMKGDRPTIAVQDPAKYKPEPNDSNVASGWYNQNARIPDGTQ